MSSLDDTLACVVCGSDGGERKYHQAQKSAHHVNKKMTIAIKLIQHLIMPVLLMYRILILVG